MIANQITWTENIDKTLPIIILKKNINKNKTKRETKVSNFGKSYFVVLRRS